MSLRIGSVGRPAFKGTEDPSIGSIYVCDDQPIVTNEVIPAEEQKASVERFFYSRHGSKPNAVPQENSNPIQSSRDIVRFRSTITKPLKINLGEAEMEPADEESKDKLSNTRQEKQNWPCSITLLEWVQFFELKFNRANVIYTIIRRKQNAENKKGLFRFIGKEDFHGLVATLEKAYNQHKENAILALLYGHSNSELIGVLNELKEFYKKMSAEEKIMSGNERSNEEFNSAVHEDCLVYEFQEPPDELPLEEMKSSCELLLDISDIPLIKTSKLKTSKLVHFIHEYASMKVKLLVAKTNSAGGNIIHYAYLIKKYEIGRWLVQHFPCEALEPYSDDVGAINKHNTLDVKPHEMPFTGENILHIIVIHKNVVEARWLLEFYLHHKDTVRGGLHYLLHGNVTGSFFRQHGSFYAGSFPIHFAATSNFKKMFDLVLSFHLASSALYAEINLYSNAERCSCGRETHRACSRRNLELNALFLRDRYGNNCLHLCVILRLFDMYKHIKDAAVQVIKSGILFAYLQHISNVKDSALNSTLSGPENVYNYSNTTDFGPTTATETVLQVDKFELPDWNNSCNKNTTTSKYFMSEVPIYMNRFLGLDSLFFWMFDIDTDFSFWYWLFGEMKEDLTFDGLKHKGFCYGYSPIESNIELPVELQRVEHSEAILPKLYEAWLHKEAQKKVRERLEWVLNEDFHSPLTLAAAGIDGEDFKGTDDDEELEMKTIKEIICESKIMKLSYGPVKVFDLNLEGVDIPHNYNRYLASKFSKPLPRRAKDVMRGVIEWICITDSEKSIGIPEVELVINIKWDRFGKWVLLVLFILRLTVTILVTLIVIYSNISPSYTPVNQTQTFVSALYFIVMAILSLLFLLEIPSIASYGLQYFGITGNRIRNSATYDKVLTTIIFCLYVTLFFESLNASSNGTNGNTAGLETYDPPVSATTRVYQCFVSFFSWTHLFYFFMATKSTGPFVLTISRIIGKDIPFFLIFYLVAITGFACALSALVGGGDLVDRSPYENFFKGIADLVQITVNMGIPADTNFIINNAMEGDKLFFSIVLTSFYIFAVLMFLNLLIGMINDTYSTLTSYNKELLVLEKYNILSGLLISPVIQAFNPVQFYCLPNQDTTQDKQKLPDYDLELTQDDPTWRESKTIEATAIKDNLKPSALFTKLHKHDPKYVKGFASLTGHGDESEDRYSNIIANDLSAIGMDSKRDISLGSSEESICLLILDPQNDFHDAPYGIVGDTECRNSGSLAVPGSARDSERTSEFILQHIDCIKEIIVTLDSHHTIHIAHSMFWVSNTISSETDDKVYDSPKPFTVITSNDVKSGRWLPRDKRFVKWCEHYCRELEKYGKTKLTIWPEHCIIGTAGHAIVPAINAAIQEWAIKRFKSVNYVRKGMNCRTEMYSALRANVEDPEDPETSLNEDLIAKLNTYDRIFVCGQALSHTVKDTLSDIIKYCRVDLRSIYLLEDCTSSVKGFEKNSHDFKLELLKKGVNVIQSVNYCRLSKDNIKLYVPNQDKSTTSTEKLWYRADCLGYRIPVLDSPSKAGKVLSFIKHKELICVGRTLHYGFHKLVEVEGCKHKGYVFMSMDDVAWNDVIVD